ncbi:heme/copper-type cytochrome/quinol oxidase subunit 4 [Parabacteroides sp. PFB2-10]|uniref:Yip1 family protein n=1 Tax=Parabacteroides sp. PFB2-10 TaxID=1742405 RepID=UPI002475CAA9|nr:Yip1 family protein [Parabacteroides sp. PFB2-10]MDH6313593.1 heme/copper-type cytochrome/quinol oxidase subunit 4 [Parabacteroides sp. PFB2-10]MDL2245051.1 YIP1 family protein [Parabacteroides sp. OttesenSCG-928-J18]
MFKEIFKWVVSLAWQPRKAWEELANKEEGKEDFLGRFVYPLMGLLTVAAFLGILVTRKEFDVEVALKASIRTLVAFFGGYHLTVYLLNEIGSGWFKREKDLKRWQYFVGYSSSFLFALTALLMLVPEFFFLKIFVLYTFYIVWEGAPAYMQVEENEKVKFVAVVTGMILLVPNVIEIILKLLMPGLRF